MNRGTWGGKVTGRRGSVPIIEEHHFSSHQRPNRLWDPPASISIAREESEADHSPPSIAEAQNAWRCTSTFPVRFYDAILKHKDNWKRKAIQKLILQFQEQENL
jgi:hypothetical protein